MKYCFNRLNQFLNKLKLNISIKTRFLILVISLIIIPSLVTNVIYTIVSDNLIKQEMLSSMELSIAYCQAKLEYITDDCSNILSVLSSSDDIQTILRKRSSRDLDYFILYNNITNTFQKITMTKDYIHSIYMIDLSTADIYFADNSKTVSLSKIENTDWFKNIINNESKVIWSYDQNLYNKSGKKFILCGKTIYDTNNRNNKLGMLIMFVDLSEINKLVAKNKNHNIILMDKNNTILLDNNSSNVFKNFNECYHIDTLTNSKEIYISDIRYLMLGSDINNAWKILLLNPLDGRAFKKDDSTFKFFIISSTIWIISLIALTSFFILKVSNPISKLIKLMKYVEKGNFDIRFNAQTNDEIGQLGKSFNAMLYKIKQLIKNIETAKNRQKQMELVALQSQINPHFLYNSLDVINWKVQQNVDRKDISNTILALADYYNQVLSKSETFIPVHEEINHIHNYLFLQKMGYDDKFSYNFNIDKNVLEYKTLKFILQPIVENSLIHGILPDTKSGHIIINGYQSEKNLIFEVIDDGVGIDQKTLMGIFGNKIKPKNSYGIKNVNDRIKLAFNTDCGLIYESRVNHGTKVIVKLPIIK